MNKAAGILKILTIIMNAILCVFLTLAILEAGSEGVYLFLMLLVILTAALNILILSFGKRFFLGIRGIVSVCLLCILNGCSLLGVMTGLFQYGLPESPIAAAAVIIWLIFPLITLPTLFVVRSQTGKSTNGGTITCPNCGTEIQQCFGKGWYFFRNAHEVGIPCSLWTRTKSNNWKSFFLPYFLPDYLYTIIRHPVNPAKTVPANLHL